MTTQPEAKQTPLIELLRGVPESARALREINEYEHQNVPYGRLMNEAADEIERLTARVAELEADALRAGWLRENSNNYDVTQKDGYGGRELMGWEYLDAAIDAAREVKP